MSDLSIDDDINFKLNDDNNSDQKVTIFKGKTEAVQEAIARTVSGLMASEIALLTCVTMRERTFTAMTKWL